MAIILPVQSYKISHRLLIKCKYDSLTLTIALFFLANFGRHPQPHTSEKILFQLQLQKMDLDSVELICKLPTKTRTPNPFGAIGVNQKSLLSGIVVAFHPLQNA